MPFQYKCVLMVGATSGIGAAMASRLVEEGSKVIAVGRRQELLDQFVNKHGPDRASSVKFDVSDSAQMDHFVNKITEEHPDLDCVFLNAGVQIPMILAEPETIDLSVFHKGFTTNYISLVDLTVKFLPFLMKKSTETSLIYTGSNIAIVPAAAGLSAYSASKAALNVFVLCLRDELRNTAVKVIELSPPPVQTELHMYRDESTGQRFGMPLEAFTEEAYRELESGKDQIVIGAIGPADKFNEIIDSRRTAFENLAKMMRGELKH